jgi:hypothetical protein
MASFSEAPRERPRSRPAKQLSVRALGSLAIVVFVLLVALGFVR